MSDEQAPLLRVTKGNPSPEEVAVITAVIAARGHAQPQKPPTNFSLWARRSRLIRPAMQPGPGAWRGSTYPR